MALPEIALTVPAGRSSRPLVVLGHSLGTGPLIWEKVVPSLEEEYQVSLLSLPGHDVATVPDETFTIDELADSVASALSDLTDQPALFAGVSIGGALALTLALRYPELFAGVASIASAPSLGSAEHWSERAAMVRRQSTSALVISSASAWFAPDSIKNEPDLTGRILRVLQNVSDEGYARCAEALGSYDLRERLGEIRIPVLAMGGEHDTIAPEERQDEIVSGVVEGRKVMIAGAGHQPPAEQAEAVAAQLLAFFGEIAK